MSDDFLILAMKVEARNLLLPPVIISKIKPCEEALSFYCFCDPLDEILGVAALKTLSKVFIKDLAMYRTGRVCGKSIASEKLLLLTYQLAESVREWVVCHICHRAHIAPSGAHSTFLPAGNKNRATCQFCQSILYPTLSSASFKPVWSKTREPNATF